VDRLNIFISVTVRNFQIAVIRFVEFLFRKYRRYSQFW